MKRKQLGGLIARNLRVYFSDPTGVILSLLGAMIVVFLYILFLSNMQVDSIVAEYPTLPRETAENLMNTWLMAGASAIAAATTGLGAMITFVTDRATKRFDDFLVSPISRSMLTLGYMLVAIVISAVMTTVVFGFGVAYCFATGADLAWVDIGMAFVALLFCAISFSAIFGFVGSLLKTTGAFSSTSVVVGTALGFFAGVYLPVGVFSTSIGNIVSILPFAQGAALVRNFFMNETIEEIAVLSPVAADSLNKYLGVSLSVASHDLSFGLIAIILGGFAVVFTCLMWLAISRKVR